MKKTGNVFRDLAIAITLWPLILMVKWYDYHDNTTLGIVSAITAEALYIYALTMVIGYFIQK